MSNHRHYKVRDYQFSFQVLQLREKVGLTQAQVASLLQVTERAIQHWEGGGSRPTRANLRKLIALYLAHGAFTPHHERAEAKALWEQGCVSTAHWQAAFNDNWFTALLDPQDDAHHTLSQAIDVRHIPIQSPNNTSSPLAHANTGLELSVSSPHTPTMPRTQDWGEASDISTFYGREQELAKLEHWILSDQCRLVALLGMGGIGKTALSVKIARRIAPHFDFVLWRSLHNAPPFEELINDCIQFLSKQDSMPQNSEKCTALFSKLLREHRCLVVFDNIDALLQEGDLQGRYRDGYEAYDVLIQRIAEIGHRSCVLLTSREMLGNLGPLDGRDSPVRALKLAGLGHEASQQILKNKSLFGEPVHWSLLIERYAGNPLTLKIVAEAVRELFGGDIAAFLQEGYILFHDILLLLNHQFERLAPLEQDLMYWFAIERDPVSLEELSANFIYPLSKGLLLEALKSLRRRCLIERGETGASFTLQPVVLEYVTERLIGQVTADIRNGHFTLLAKYALMQGQAKEYLRQSQIRLLLLPALKRLMAHFGSELELEQHLISLLTHLRTMPHAEQGYSGGNIVNLLVHLRGHIRGVDFSHLVIRQAYLQEIEGQDASFVGADLTNSVFMEIFDSIAAVALSPDGKYLAMGSFNGQICVWQVADGKPLLAFKGHARMVWSIAFSPDSTLLASGSYDRNVKLWHIGSGDCIKTFKGHSEWVREVIFHPNGHLLASSGDDKTVRIWNVADGTCLHVLRGHSDSIWSIAFHPDGKTLVSGSPDKMLRLWDVGNGTCLAILHTHAEEIFAVAFSHDGKLIASGGEGGIRLWDSEKHQQVRRLSQGISWSWSITFTPEGVLANGGNDGNVTLWDAASGQCIRTLQDHHGHNGRIWSIAFAARNLLASGSDSGRVKLWNTSTGHCLRTFQGYNRVICALAFSPDGRILANGDDQGMIRLWEVSSGRCLTEWRGHNGRVWSLIFSPDGKTLASGGIDQHIKIWDTLTRQCLNTLSGHSGVIWSVAFSPDSSTLASGSLDRTIKLWDVNELGNNQCIRTWQGSNRVWSVAFNLDGSILASGSADGVIEIWDTLSGTCLNILRSSPSPIGSVAFHPDGHTLVSSSNDGVVRIWEIASGHCLRTMPGVGNISWVKYVAFSSDGAMLATGCNDRTIKMWHVNNEQEVRTLTGHKGGIWSVAFSPDGCTLASGDDDGIILLWTIQSNGLAKCLRSDRPFERMNMHNATGITQAQKASLKVLGAIEHASPDASL